MSTHRPSSSEAQPAADRRSAAGDRRIRVAYIQRPAGGGSMTALIDMIRLLDRTRFEPIVILHGQTPYSEQFLDMGAKVRILASRPRAAATPRAVSRATAPLRKWNELRDVRRLLRTDLPLARKIAGVLREEAADLVHQNDHPRADRASILAARILGLPQVCHVRYVAPEYHFVDRVLSRAVTYHIFVSRAVERAFREAVDIGPEKGRTIHEAVDVRAHLALNGSAADTVRAELGLRAGERMVVNVGRIVPWKGHDVFLEALAVVAHEHEAVRGIIVGSPPDNDRGHEWLRTLREQVDALGLTERIVFTGFRSDVHRIVGAADVVVHSATRAEPFGRVVVEAMAAGRAVIATRGGGILDIVTHGDNGLLVTQADPIEMAKAITQLLDDPEEARRLGSRARAAVQEEFRPERFGSTLMALYEGLVGHHAA